MNKKNYLMVGIVGLVFLLIIIFILIKNNTAQNWTSNIQNSQNYKITMIDCNGRAKVLPNNTLNILSDNWKELSNNGPWTGDNNICYTTLTFSYENNGVINTKEILIIDDSSLALIESTQSTYYTNAERVISYLNTLFTN